MKRILILALGVLMFAGAATGQTNEKALVAKERAAIDSIAASCDSLVTMATAVLTDNITLSNGFTIAASGIMTLPKPLVPVGDHSTASFTVKCIGTAPDTTYFQIVAGATSYDTLTVLNIGTLATPVLSGAWPAALFAVAHPWHSTGVEFTLGIDLKTLSNAKFIGIRLSPDDSRAGTYATYCNLK